jgi:hypothetical protein
MSGSTSTSAQQRLNAAVQLPQWVNQLVGNQNQLSENDLRKIEAAREFAAKLTAKVRSYDDN